jgi:hypothetical protein
MINQVRSDFASNRRAAVVLAAIMGLGLACWLPPLVARSVSRNASPPRQQVSVLSDPFATEPRQRSQ